MHSDETPFANEKTFNIVAFRGEMLPKVCGILILGYEPRPQGSGHARRSRCPLPCGRDSIFHFSPNTRTKLFLTARPLHSQCAHGPNRQKWSFSNRRPFHMRKVHER